MANVGGDPAQMTGGAAELTTSGTVIEQTAAAISSEASSSSGAAGYSDLAGAISRLGAGLGASVEDVGSQCRLAAQLAENAADDLVSATGG